MPNIPLHHLVKRKQTERRIPLAKTFWIGLIDVAIYPIGALSLVLTIPQVYEVWVLQNVEGISLITWSMWSVSSVFWFIYAVIHRVTAVMVMQIGWLILYLLVITGVLIFR